MCFPTWELINVAFSGSDPKGVKHGRTPSADWTEVVNVPFEDGPQLPKRERNRKWHPRVQVWWNVVRKLPHCVLWDPADWEFAIDTAFMKQEFWADMAEGKMASTAATEIRRREDVMGTTREARRKLRIRFIDPADVSAVADVEEDPVVEHQETAGRGGVAGVTPLASRRKRLTA